MPTLLPHAETAEQAREITDLPADRCGNQADPLIFPDWQDAVTVSQLRRCYEGECRRSATVQELAAAGGVPLPADDFANGLQLCETYAETVVFRPAPTPDHDCRRWLTSAPPKQEKP